MSRIHTVTSEKGNDDLETVVKFFRSKVMEEHAELDELTNRYHRLCELHVQRQLYLPQSKLHGELVRLQEHILDAQDEIMEYECEMKVLRKMVKRNEKIMARLRNGDWRDIKQTTKSNSSQSLLSTNTNPVEPFLSSPAAA
ncbi:hypothetical protein MHU86_20644 [Fragilaria crotonensis]|nr:hypothetical protein MHU86_20644 [Fragilaria crotonensis]